MEVCGSQNSDYLCNKNRQIAMDISQNDPRFNDFQNVKRRFFALRNGIVADVLRKGGDPHTIIFGLTLPQLREVADATGVDNVMADVLWQNRSTRESRLLAPMIADAALVSEDRAVAMVEDVMCVEEADILCHRLLRRLPFAVDIVDKYKDDAEPLRRYVALRLMLNLASVNPKMAKTVADVEAARNHPLTQRVAMQLADEADFLME